MESKYQCVNIVASGHTTANLSRHSLLQWINELLDIKIQKVEDLRDGAVYCQIMDMIFPGCISLKKVKFDAKQNFEFWKNFKLLQNAFRTVGCEKCVPIDILIEGRFQENFEFLQWFKRFFDVNIDSAAVTQKPRNLQRSTYSTSATSSTSGSSITTGTSSVSIPFGTSITSSSSSGMQPPRTVAAINPVSKKAEEEKLESEIYELRSKAEQMILEKDFYFRKLQNIEAMCTSPDAAEMDKQTMVEKILAELYATEEGFVEPPVEEEED